MAIPLVGGTPPAAKYEELLTGNSSTFAASNGNWTNSGGTLTWDSGSSYGWPGAGSLKLVTSAASQYAECAIPGAFKSGVRYIALVVVKIEEEANATFSLNFGLIGTDVESVSIPVYSNDVVAGKGHVSFYVSWVPTGSRSGVKVRLTRTQAAGTLTYHVANCRVFRLVAGSLGVNDPDTSGYGLSVKHLSQSIRISHGAKFNAGLTFEGYQTYIVGSETSWSAFGARAGTVWITADEEEAAPTSLSDTGVNFEVGVDYIGFNISEKDSDTVQLYADQTDGYDIELRDRGAGKGWKAADSDGNETGLLSKSPFRSLSDEPMVAAEGDCYYDTTDHVLRVFDGISWRDCWYVS